MGLQPTCQTPAPCISPAKEMELGLLGEFLGLGIAGRCCLPSSTCLYHFSNRCVANPLLGFARLVSRPTRAQAVALVAGR